ncbi:hypothetical protein [Streptomyces coelicoflavus]|uniref:hypothetical protein n=1 Tax=Streptomyces coelicoflavus TaxID=285562 RepID=UPI002E2554E9
MRRLLWLTAAAFLAAGCSQGPGREVAADVQPDPRPLDGALHFTAAEAAELHRSEEQEIRQCMNRRGFGYRVGAAGDVEGQAAESPYGLLTQRRASTDGYGLTVRRLRTPPTDPNTQQVSSLTVRERRAWEEALKGSPDGPREEIVLQDGPTLSVATDSCVSVGRRALYGASWERDHYTVQHLRNAIVKDTLDHPLVKAAERKWAACMRDEGFRYEHREDPLKALKKRLDATGSDAAALRATGREELKIAVRDAVCQAEAGLAEEISRAQKQVEKALPPARTSRLAEFRTARDSALRRAGVPA